MKTANRKVIDTHDDMARAIRTLLIVPLLTREVDDAAFTLVRRRRTELTRWFDYFCGWRLTVEPRQGYARLAKVRAADSHLDVPRPARRVRGAREAFDRRRYTLLCLAAAELLTVGRTTIGLLAERVAHACAADDAVPGFDPSSRAERSAYVDALLLLERYGAITALDGVTESYLTETDAKVLYRADAVRLTRLLCAPVPPSRVASNGLQAPDLTALVHEERYGPARAGSDETQASLNQRNLWARHSVMRRLLDDPVVYRSDLSPAEAEYAATVTGRSLIHRMAQEAGFSLEERAEGYLLVDTAAVATDTRFPGEGDTAKQTALLLLDVLLHAVEPVPATELAAEVARLMERRPSWAKSYRSAGGATELADSASAVLVGFGLAAWSAGPGDPARLYALPAAHRYAVDGTAFEEEP
ncbi:TIGR02678 family protein [Nocardiopsis mangrovi]|uniref:TIGR02678 family protein n=1 Tax=Nocardiopsis mangrovi TaxID=1179818 RepID=A0ABV9DVP7_9ACTN